MQHITIRGLIAFAVSIVILLAFAACGGDDNVSPSASQSGTPTPATSPTPPSTNDLVSPTATPTAPPQLAGVLALPGFTDFARQFQSAIERNDTQFVIDHTRFADYTCSHSGGMPAEPDNCASVAVGTVVQAIGVGFWNSDGEYQSPSAYADFIRLRLAPAAAGEAYVYALGHEKRGTGESSSGVDVVVSYVAPLGASPGTALAQDAALSFRLDQVSGDWQIVGMDVALTSQVPDFYDWHTSWEQAFPPEG